MNEERQFMTALARTIANNDGVVSAYVGKAIPNYLLIQVMRKGQSSRDSIVLDGDTWEIMRVEDAAMLVWELLEDD